MNRELLEALQKLDLEAIYVASREPMMSYIWDDPYFDKGITKEQKEWRLLPRYRRIFKKFPVSLPI